MWMQLEIITLVRYAGNLLLLFKSLLTLFLYSTISVKRIDIGQE